MEAVIAILLVLGFLLYILPRVPALTESTMPEGLNSAREYILNRFLTDNELRDCVKNAKLIESVDDANKCINIEYDNEKTTECRTKISDLLTKNTPSGFTFACEICTGTNPCTQVLNDDNAKKSIYPGSLFMYFPSNTKYLRIYFWRE